MTFELAGQIAGIISLAAFIPYILAIVNKKTSPNKVTWWVWTLVGILLVGSQYFATGSINTLWLPIGLTIGNLIVALLSLRYHDKGKMPSIDKYCLFGALLGLAVWLLLDSPLVALMIIVLVDFLATAPTVLKAYGKPKTENALTWGLFVLADILSIVSVERFELDILLMPTHFLLSHGAILLAIWVGMKKIR